MLTGITNIAFSGDGTTAEAPVVFEVASSATGDARTNATICPFGNTFNVADITKSDAPDLIITAVLAFGAGGVWADRIAGNGIQPKALDGLIRNIL